MSHASSHLPARFQPRRPSSRVALLFLLGPLVWLVALVVLAFVLNSRDAVEYALVAFAVSFAAALPLLGWTRHVRDREEHDA